MPLKEMCRGGRPLSDCCRRRREKRITGKKGKEEESLSPRLNLLQRAKKVVYSLSQEEKRGKWDFGVSGYRERAPWAEKQNSSPFRSAPTVFGQEASRNSFSAYLFPSSLLLPAPDGIWLHQRNGRKIYGKMDFFSEEGNSDADPKQCRLRLACGPRSILSCLDQHSHLTCATGEPLLPPPLPLG